MTRSKNDTEFFWTDIDQASEKLLECVILCDDTPVQVIEIRKTTDSKIPEIVIELLSDGRILTLSLADDSFHNFRKLPQLGWMNLHNDKKPTCIFLSRRLTRSRLHGLNNQNVIVREL